MPRWSKANIVDGHRVPQRMFPRYGGHPLPHQPIVAPPYVWPLVPGGIVGVAKWYVQVLDKELAEGIDSGERAKWSGSQRQYLRELRAKWIVRAQGLDPHYIKHGTFSRPIDAAPPTIRDLEAQRHRYQAMDQGTFESNTEHYRRTHTNSGTIRGDIVKRWKKQAEGQGHKAKKQHDPHGE